MAKRTGRRLDRDVVDDLIVGALQERRIDHRERLEAFGGEAGGERHAVLFGDADVEAAFREALGEEIEAGARRHRGGDRHDLLVGFGFGDQAFGEDFRVLRRVRLRSSSARR